MGVVVSVGIRIRRGGAARRYVICCQSQEIKKALQTNVYRTREEAWGLEGVVGPFTWPAVPIVDVLCAGCAGLLPEY